MSCRLAAQRCALQLRASTRVRPAGSAGSPLAAVLSRSHTAAQPTRRHSSTDAAVEPKIAAIVDQISQLTLLETASLVSSLKTRLNIPDLPVGGFAAAPAAAPAAAEEEEAPAAPAEKSLFTVKLVGFEAGSKPKVIKEIKNLLGLSLVDSKKFVESAPKTMKESVPKDEAEKMIAALKELGANVTME